MNGLTRFFLIVLRIAIGWHFFFEGIEKVESIHRGRTETSRPFSSEGYLREASGPFARIIREQIGDLDALTLEKLTPKSAEVGELRDRFPAAAEKDWEDYLKRFVVFYEVDQAGSDKGLAALLKAKEAAVKWLLEGKKEVDRAFSKVDFKPTRTTADRIKEYREKVEKVRELQDTELPKFDQDVEKQRLRTLKAEVARLRNELLGELDQPMKDALQGVLTEEQKRKGPLPERDSPLYVDERPWHDRSRIEWIDRITAWGLVVVGGCLIVGLCTRTACLAGALFLAMLYLAMPPFPWVPEVTRTEGHYYFVNKNLVELLALLALATTRSGYWIGLDGIVQFLNPFRRRG